MQWKHLTVRHGVIITTNKICILCQELDEMLWKTQPLLMLAYWYSHLCLRLNLDTERTLVCSSPTTLSYFSLSQRTYKELRQCLTGCRALMHLCSYGRRPLPASETPRFSLPAPRLPHRSLSLDCNWFFKLCVPCLLTDWSSCLK